MTLIAYDHNLTVLAASSGESIFGWIVLGCLLLPFVIGLSRHALLWLCRGVGAHSLITISALMLFATILATPFAIKPHAAKSPEPEPSEGSGGVSAHQLLGVPEPEQFPETEEQERWELARVDPVGLTLPGGRVSETIVGLVAWIPSCVVDGGNFREPRWPFREAWSPLTGIAWWLIPPASLLCLLGVLYTALVLPSSLVDIRSWSKSSSEPPLPERRPALIWLGALLVPVFLNDLGIIAFPGIVVSYLTLACFASLFAFREFAADKAWAIKAMISRQEAVARQDELIHSAMEEGDFIEEISLGDVESGPSGRVPESTLLFYAFIGGWPGALAAQGLLWHKVSKRKEGFRLELAVAIFMHCLFISLLFCAMMGFYS